MPEKKNAEMDWDATAEYFYEVLSRYRELPMPSGMPALLLTFGPLQQRYESGERSRELYDAMWGVE